MITGLIVLVLVLLAVAIAVQVAYLRMVAKSGAEIPRSVKLVTGVNIALLSAIALGIIVYAFVGGPG